MNADINLSFKNYLDQFQVNILDVLSFISSLLVYEKQIDFLVDENKFLLYINLGNAYSLDGPDQDLSLAERYLKDAELKFTSVIIKNYVGELYFNLGHLYARKRCSEKSKAYFEKYILNPVKGDGLKMESNFYSFRKTNKYIISDLVNNEITLSNPKIFNDPYDTLLFQFLDYRKRKIIKESKYDISPMIEAYNPIRVRCFSNYTIKENQIIQPILNRLLWSHYADEFRGICVLYEFLRPQNGISNLAGTNSVTEWYHADYLEMVVFGDIKNATPQLLFATKHKDWKYENEVRLIHYDPTITKEQQHIQIPLENLGGKIKAIIFGSHCSQKDEQTIRELFKNQDIFFKVLGTELLDKNDNVYDLRIDNEEKWKELIQK